MKTKVVYTQALEYAKRVRIIVSEYNDGSLYVGLYTMSGEPYADVTTHIEKLNGNLAYVEFGAEVEDFIIEQDLLHDLEPFGDTVSGYNIYRLFRFDFEDKGFKEVDESNAANVT